MNSRSKFSRWYIAVAEFIALIFDGVISIYAHSLLGLSGISASFWLIVIAVAACSLIDENNNKLIAILNKAHKKGIKIVVVDSQMADKAHVDATLLSDNYQAGVLCAKALMKKKKRANILLLEHYSAMSANDRIRGFTDTLFNKNRNT